MKLNWRGKEVQEHKFWNRIHTDAKHMSPTDFHWEVTLCVMKALENGDIDSPLLAQLCDFSSVQGPLNYNDFFEKFKASEFVRYCMEVIAMEFNAAQGESVYDQEKKVQMMDLLSSLLQKRNEVVTAKSINALVGGPLDMLFHFWKDHLEASRVMFKAWFPHLLSYDYENSEASSALYHRSNASRFTPYKVASDNSLVQNQDFLYSFEKSVELSPRFQTITKIQTFTSQWREKKEFEMNAMMNAPEVLETLLKCSERLAKVSEDNGKKTAKMLGINDWFRDFIVYQPTNVNIDFMFKSESNKPSFVQRLHALNGNKARLPHAWLVPLFIRKNVVKYADQLNPYFESAKEYGDIDFVRLSMGELLTNRYQQWPKLRMYQEGRHYSPDTIQGKLNAAKEQINNGLFFDFIGHEKNLKHYISAIDDSSWAEKKKYLHRKVEGEIVEEVVSCSSFEQAVLDVSLLESEIGFKETIATLTNLLRHTPSISEENKKRWGEVLITAIRSDGVLSQQIVASLNETFDSLCIQEKWSPDLQRPILDIRALFIQAVLEKQVPLVSTNPEEDLLLFLIKEKQIEKMPLFLSKAFAACPEIAQSAVFKDPQAVSQLKTMKGIDPLFDAYLGIALLPSMNKPKLLLNERF